MTNVNENSVTVVNIDTALTDPSAPTVLGRADYSTVMVKPRWSPWWYIRFRAQRLRDAATRLGVRTLSATLGLSWRLDLIIPVDAEIVAAESDTARTALRQFLHDPASRVVICVLDREPTGWRDLCTVPIEAFEEITAETDGFDDLPLWSVGTTVTASTIVDACVAAQIDRYSDAAIEPVRTPEPIERVLAIGSRIRRTPVRRRHAQ